MTWSWMLCIPAETLLSYQVINFQQLMSLSHIIKTHDSESRGQEEAQQRDH